MPFFHPPPYREVRLVEGHYRCDLQCAAAHLGALYGVLSKRRGTVLDDDVVSRRF